MQRYRPILDALDLTYPQYITMMALWENNMQTVNRLGEKLKLDSGTLTPLLKRLEAKKLIKRTRSTEDERVVNITLTKEGENLRKKATCVPLQIITSLNLDMADMEQLKVLSDKIIQQTQEK